jgi:hypothetical protein
MSDDTDKPDVPKDWREQWVVLEEEIPQEFARITDDLEKKVGKEAARKSARFLVAIALRRKLGKITEAQYKSSVQMVESTMRSHVSAAGVAAGKFITEWIKKAIPIFVPMVWK